MALNWLVVLWEEILQVRDKWAMKLRAFRNRSQQFISLSLSFLYPSNLLNRSRGLSIVYLFKDNTFSSTLTRFTERESRTPNSTSKKRIQSSRTLRESILFSGQNAILYTCMCMYVNKVRLDQCRQIRGRGKDSMRLKKMGGRKGRRRSENRWIPCPRTFHDRIRIRIRSLLTVSSHTQHGTVNFICKCFIELISIEFLFSNWKDIYIYIYIIELLSSVKCESSHRTDKILIRQSKARFTSSCLNLKYNPRKLVFLKT